MNPWDNQSSLSRLQVPQDNDQRQRVLVPRRVRLHHHRGVRQQKGQGKRPMLEADHRDKRAGEEDRDPGNVTKAGKTQGTIEVAHRRHDVLRVINRSKGDEKKQKRREDQRVSKRQ